MVNQAEPETKVMQVRVTNLNDFPLTDMFDGVEYEVPAMGALSMPVDAAYHIFGWHPPVTDANGVVHQCDDVVRKNHCYKRFGWNTPSMMGKAHIFYQNLKIQPIIYRMVVEEEQPPEEDIAPQTQAMQGPVAPPARAPKRNSLMEAAAQAANR